MGTRPLARIVAVVLVLDVCSSVGVAAQDSTAALVVRVRADLGAPVVGAEISFAAAHLTGVTDSRGIASFGAMPGGAEVLRVRALGYRPLAAPLTLTPAETTAVIVTLHPLVGKLPEVEILGRANAELQRDGFYERQLTWRGTFITRTQIADWKPVRTRDVLARAGGVRVSDKGISVPTAVGGGCSGVSEYIDGALVTDHREDDFGGVRSLAIDKVPVDRIAGMEVYVMPTVPPRYATGSPCAVVLVWLVHETP